MRTAVVVATLLAVLLGVAPQAGATAQDAAPDGEASPEQQLVDRYAPVYMLKAQDEECDSSGEQYEPVPVETVLGNPQVVWRQLGTANPVMGAAPTAEDVHDLGEGFYLDFPGDALDPGCIYEQDNRRYSAGLPNVVYAHIATQEGIDDKLAVQYWSWWYYNDWNNRHEGDWEFIQVLFPVGTVEEALRTEPESVGYSQHEGGERADWDSSKLDRDGTRPIVYASAGSHASYYGSALYLGRSGGEGFGCDNTDGPSREVRPEAVLVPDQPSGPDDPFAWLAFEGRWGERQSSVFNGPTGPAQKDRWDEPVTWHDDLRSSAVIVPQGDSFGDTAANAFCAIVEGGAQVLLRLKTSPLQVVIAAALLLWLMTLIVRRTDWSPSPLHPIRRRRAAGQALRNGWHLYKAHPLRFALIGAVYLPTFGIAAGVVALARTVIPFLGDLLDVAGDRSATGGVFALGIGSIAHVFAWVFIGTSVASMLAAAEDGRPVRAVDGVRAAWERIVPLALGTLRATVIVVLLLVSIVGIPWGLRQIVRYQLLPPTVALEPVGTGREALARSTALVRGRWWRTAGLVLALQVLVGLIALLCSVLLLVIARSLPLWAFNAGAALVFALVVPWAALVITLWYGNAIAEQTGDDEPDEPGGPAGEPALAGAPSGG